MGVREINVTFHKNCENMGKVLKTSCVRCNFVKIFDIHFSGFHQAFSLVLLQMTITSLSLKKCKKECYILQIILVQGFYPLKIEITQSPGVFHANIIYKITTLENFLTIK